MKLIDDEAFEDFLDWLRQWSRTYPEEMFPNIDMREIAADKRDYSHAEVLSIAQRNAAGMGRGCIARVLERAETLGHNV